MAHRIDPSRAICGIATCFDTSPRSGKPWGAHQFDIATTLELSIPLRLNQEPTIASWGLTDSIGTVERFVSVEYPVPGLLILGQIGEANGFGDSILRDISKSLSFEYFDPTWSFSVGALWDGEDQVILQEISLTRRPGFPAAKVLAVGDGAVELFAMLTRRGRSAGNNYKGLRRSTTTAAGSFDSSQPGAVSKGWAVAGLSPTCVGLLAALTVVAIGRVFVANRSNQIMAS